MTEQNPVQIDPDLTNVTKPRLVNKKVFIAAAAIVAVPAIVILARSRQADVVVEAAQDLIHDTAADVADATK